MSKRYEKKTLPELYLIATHKGVKGFFGKNKKEVIALIEKADENLGEMDETSQPETKDAKVAKKSKKDTGSKKKKKQKPVDEEELIEDEDEEIDVDEDEEEAPKKKSKRKDANVEDEGEEEDEDEYEEDSEDEDEDEEEEKPAKKKAKKPVVEDDEDEEEDEDEYEEDSEDEDEDEDEEEGDELDKLDRAELRPIYKKEVGQKVKKTMEDDEIREAIRKARAADDEDDEEEDEKPAKKAKKSKKSSGSNGRAKIEKDPSKTDSPFQDGTAGHFVFLALKKGGSIAKIVECADAMIEKAEAKPPANTEQKVKIIMKEINAGKRGKGWGHFVMSDKGKVTYEE